MTAVRVHELKPGAPIRLPSGRIVDVERVDRYRDGSYIVRWHQGSVYREPHGLAGQRQRLGPLRPLRKNDVVEVAR